VQRSNQSKEVVVFSTNHRQSSTNFSFFYIYLSALLIALFVVVLIFIEFYFLVQEHKNARTAFDSSQRIQMTELEQVFSPL